MKSRILFVLFLLTVAAIAQRVTISPIVPGGSGGVNATNGVGAAGQYLTSDGTNAYWAAVVASNTNIPPYVVTNNQSSLINLSSAIVNSLQGNTFIPLSAGASKLLRTDSSTNVQAVTIGAGLTFDGTTISSGHTNIYTNVKYVNATGTAAQNGTTLTNLIHTSSAGTFLIVGPGNYSIPINEISFLKNGVGLYFEPDAIVTSGTTADSTNDRWLFEDYGGVVTNQVLGYGKFYLTNSSSSGALFRIQNSASVVTFEYSVAHVIGQSPCIVVENGNLTLHGRELTRSDSYDALYVIAGKVRATGGRLEGGDSIIETASCAAWGDQVFTFLHGEALSSGVGVSAINMADNTYAKFNTLKIDRSASIYGNATNLNEIGSGVLEAGVIYTKTNSIYSLIQRSGSSMSTALTLKNATIYAPWNVDAIEANTMGGYLTLENCRIIPGVNSTNIARSVNASRLRIVGNLSLDSHKPMGSGITVSGVSYANTYRGFGDMLVAGTGYFTNGIFAYGDTTVEGTLLATDVAVVTPTANRPAFIDGSGFITAASGTPDGTKFMRDDGVLAVPSAGSVNDTGVNYLGSNTVYTGTSGTITLYGTNQNYVTYPSGTVTFEDNDLRSNIVYSVTVSNAANTVNWPGSWRWLDGETISSAPSVQSGQYVISFKRDRSGTNAWVVAGKTYSYTNGWGTVLTTNGTAVSVNLTNYPISIATNAISVPIDFSQNVQVYNSYYHLTNRLSLWPTNHTPGRTVCIYFDTNLVTFDVTITNLAGTPVSWNWNVTTNGATSFQKTNTVRARVFLTAETNGTYTAEMGYYR